MHNTEIAIMQLLPISVFSFELQVFVLPFHNCLLAADHSGAIGHRAIRRSVIASTVFYIAVFMVLAGFFEYVNDYNGLPQGWPKNSIPLVITIIVNFTARWPAIILVSLFILQALGQQPYSSWIAIEQLVILWGELKNKRFSRRIDKIKEIKLKQVGTNALVDEKPLALDRLKESEKLWLVFGLCVLNLFLVIFSDDFSFFINVCGSLSSPFIVYVLPGYLYGQMVK